MSKPGSNPQIKPSTTAFNRVLALASRTDLTFAEKIAAAQQEGDVAARRIQDEQDYPAAKRPAQRVIDFDDRDDEQNPEEPINQGSR